MSQPQAELFCLFVTADCCVAVHQRKCSQRLVSLRHKSEQHPHQLSFSSFVTTTGRRHPAVVLNSSDSVTEPEREQVNLNHHKPHDDVHRTSNRSPNISISHHYQPRPEKRQGKGTGSRKMQRRRVHRCSFMLHRPPLGR